jgi:hypothetical protein
MPKGISHTIRVPLSPLTPPISTMTQLALRMQETGATSTDVHIAATAAHDEAIDKGYISYQSLLLFPLTPLINTISALAHRIAAAMKRKCAYAAHAEGYISHHSRAYFPLDSNNQHPDPTCTQDARNGSHPDPTWTRDERKNGGCTQDARNGSHPDPTWTQDAAQNGGREEAQVE